MDALGNSGRRHTVEYRLWIVANVVMQRPQSDRSGLEGPAWRMPFADADRRLDPLIERGGLAGDHLAE